MAAETPDYRLRRNEDELKELKQRYDMALADVRNELRGVERELNVANSQISAQVLGLQASLPLTYITRQDLAERLQSERQTVENRTSGIERAVNEIQTTARQLIFAIIAALVSGGIALLIEVMRLITAGGK